MQVAPHVVSDDVVDEVNTGVEPPTNSFDVVDEVNTGVEPPTNSFDFVVEVNMGVEPPINSSDVKNKIKNHYVKTKNVLDINITFTESGFFFSNGLIYLTPEGRTKRNKMGI